LWLPLIVETSRTISQPSDGMSTRNAELTACGTSGASSVRAIRIANWAPVAPEMNHLCPLISQWSSRSSARVWISVGSEPATSGSVIAKHDRACPWHSGFRYFSFWAGVALVGSLGVHREGAEAGLGGLGGDRRHRDVAEPHPPVLLGHVRQPEPPLLGGLAHGDDLLDEDLAISLVGRDLLLRRPDDLIAELANLRADELDLVGKAEVDRHWGFPPGGQASPAGDSARAASASGSDSGARTSW
jgi:hypothetical protein